MITFSDFLVLHPVFHLEEARQACFRGKAPQTALAALYRAEKVGRVRRLKRGIYQAKPIGSKGFPPPSPLLVASRLAFDACLSHHSALEALGFAHSAFPKLATYWTNSPRHVFKIEGVSYQPLLHPEPLRKAHQQKWGVEKIQLGGLEVRVTNRERTFVDSLQAPHWVGGWEEFCHCVDKISHLNLEKVLEYASLLKSPALFSRLGFFLETNKERLFVQNKILSELHTMRSKVSVPLIVGDKEKGKLDSKWNINVSKRTIVKLEQLS